MNKKQQTLTKNSLDEDYDKLIGKSKQDIKSLLGQVFNDVNSDVWMYRVSEKFSFFKKNYLYIFFSDGKVMSYTLKKFKKTQDKNMNITNYFNS